MKFYLLAAIWVAIILISLHLGDTTARKTDPYAWIVIAISAMLWPIVLPISALEIYRKASSKDTVKHLQATETVFESRFVADRDRTL